MILKEVATRHRFQYVLDIFDRLKAVCLSRLNQSIDTGTGGSTFRAAREEPVLASGESSHFGTVEFRQNQSN